MRKKAIESAPIWNKNINAGDSVEGKFIKTEVFDSKFGSSTKYIIELSDGTKTGIYSSASLQRQFKNIPEGSYVWVTYKGEETSSNGRVVKVYEVDYDDEA
jgi:hypothetical protein